MFRFPRTSLRASLCSALVAASLAVAPVSATACTIFVLTDGKEETLFFNNEDWSNPAARLWFVPAGPGHLGCAYVGFDDGWAQGGVNTAGLAFDWVAGAMDDYTPDPALVRVRGNPSERMLETCSTVDEAIAFYRTHREPSFARASLLVADRTGASVLIESRQGRIHLDRATKSRGFGYGGRIVHEALQGRLEPTLESGVTILKACVQPGATPTRYSNVFDLRRGTITLYPSIGDDAPESFDLAEELARGGHHYTIHQVAAERSEPPRPLPREYERLPLANMPPLADADPVLVARLRTAFEDVVAGRMNPDHYSPDLWEQLQPAQREMRDQLSSCGPIRSLAVVEVHPTATGFTVRVVLDAERMQILQRIDVDDAGRFAAIATEYVERGVD